MTTIFHASEGYLTFDAPPQVIAAVAAYFRDCPRLSRDTTTDWSRVTIDPDFQRRIAAEYDGLPLVDPDPFDVVGASYRHLAFELHSQFYTIQRWGIRMVLSDADPYDSLADAAADVVANSRLAVLSTEQTGGHPLLTDAENDQFRFVHDIFGHLATGRNFDRHGEEAAFQHHRTMFTPLALPAMASETRGQNASLIINGEFGPQRAALMSAWAYR